MSVFKSFWLIVKKYKGTIILDTVILLIFGTINMTAGNNQQMNFVDSKPDVIIVNEDKESKITDNLISYIEKHSNQIHVSDKEDAILDALFYRDANYVIYIPKDYGKDVLLDKDPKISVKSTGDYMASLAEMMLNRYIKLQTIYQMQTNDEESLIGLINESLEDNVSVLIRSKLDTTKLSNASLYFSFASYSIMAVIIFIICLVMASFKEKKVYKRTIVSSMNYQEFNHKLLSASFLYAFLVWLVYVGLGFIILGNIMFSLRGLIYMLNSFVFTFCCLTIALLIGTIVTNKNAVNGIVNVLALGSAFLCGAFVPAEYIPSSVLMIAHILPSYWYINSNDILKTIEVIHFESLQPIFINSLVMVLFSILFIGINNYISKRKQKVG